MLTSPQNRVGLAQMVVIWRKTRSGTTGRRFRDSEEQVSKRELNWLKPHQINKKRALALLRRDCPTVFSKPSKWQERGAANPNPTKYALYNHCDTISDKCFSKSSELRKSSPDRRALPKNALWHYCDAIVGE